MKTLTRVALLGMLVGCSNEGGLNRSIPPIAGVVGGPDEPDGQGMVAVEIQSDESSAIPGTEIRVHNADHATADIVVVASAEVPLQHLLIQADVGDRLRIDLTHPDGETSAVFAVPRPRIAEARGVLEGGVFSAPGTVVRGRVARLQGVGFCHTDACNGITVDGGVTPLATVEDERPTEIYFFVSTNGALTAGAHTIRVNIATGAGGEPYLSNAYTVTVLDPS